MKNERTWAGPLAGLLLAIVAGGVMVTGARNRAQNSFALVNLPGLPVGTVAAGPSPWELAAKKMTEDRGEPTGRQAKVEVPDQLRHYSDRRRFLATQVAEWKEHEVSTPTDFADLARMIGSGELVEVEPITDTYILYGVGASADEAAFTHYDKKRRKEITLFDEVELAGEYSQTDESLTKIASEIKSLKDELGSLTKRDRTGRRKLQARITLAEKSLTEQREKRKLLDFFYADEASRQELSGDRELLSSLAADFSGRKYDLNDARSRKEMKMRLLSHLRPEALRVLEQVAYSYHEKFERPLPITSLVRPDEYQHQLSETNANATKINTPPHSTGLAFDIFYRHMTAAEQEFVMAELARLRDEGRVEALRENRDHFHVFAFIDGKRPAEKLILGALGEAVARSSATATATRKSTKVEKKHAGKKTVRKAARAKSRRRK